MKPINCPAQTFWRRRVSGALRLGGLLLLCAAPAGLAAGLARYIAWRPLRLILLWLLEPGCAVVYAMRQRVIFSPPLR
ncbi:hypothetical protein NMD85_09225 [Edwardsiella tarda]|uniref:hypothetical protein n=1 Tax=Edwardsiella tarda TaxID=636 RepID=UPI00351BF660